MLVREIMTGPPFRVRQDAPLEEALALMAEQHVTSLPVVDGHGHLVGIVSEMDVLRQALEHDARAHARPVPARQDDLPETVADVMTSQPRTTTEGEDVADLVEVFASTSYKSLPVVEGPHLVGVVSRSDVIRALWRPDEQVGAELEQVFAEYGQTGWDIDTSRGVVTISGAGSARERDVATALARSVLGVRRVRHVEASP